MKNRYRILAMLFVALGLAAPGLAAAAGPGQSRVTTAHDFAFRSISGEELLLSEFRGKSVLVVNTASQCGYAGQFASLQKLYERYRERGLVVLAVPSNDFGGQEPGTASDIEHFARHEYQVTFPLTGKVTVSGANAVPFYKWAGEQAGLSGKPRWNFHKHLIGPDGNFIASFSTQTEPDSPRLVRAIEESLPEPEWLRSEPAVKQSGEPKM
ncbi:MAG: glutathione peroxidase [Nitratireductor sp.]|nr:glutathione peroxidase [Nitratireductor sp.]